MCENHPKDNGLNINFIYSTPMPCIRILLFLALFPVLLAACASDSDRPTLTPMPVSKEDPSDEVLIEALQKFVKDGGAPAATGYQYVRVDLNDDGLRDALMLLKTPYGYWCGTHGCTMLVFKAHSDKFTLVNSVQPVRAPVYISVMKSNGWKNLVVRVSGRWNEAKDVALQFDGRKYPTDPSDLPPFPKKNYSGFTRAFMSNTDPNHPF